MTIEKHLLEYKMKSISREELASLCGIGPLETEPLFRRITDLVSCGLISPVKSSGTNGNKKYPIANKFRILLEENHEEAAERIKALHPTLRKNGYLAGHPQDYEKNSEIIEMLSAYLFSGVSAEPISRKERSFEIFGKEKVLDNPDIKNLLTRIGFTNQMLAFYDTPEYCFHDYIPVRKAEMTLLICENKDIWFNLRRRMFEDGASTFFGTPIDGIVYGNGNKVSQKDGALLEYVKFMGNPDVHFLYWGDIDREGFDIFLRTKKANKQQDISLFMPGYKEMIKRAERLTLEDSPSARLEEKNFDEIINQFTEGEQDFLRKALKEDKLIPQEIVSYQVLKEG